MCDIIIIGDSMKKGFTLIELIAVIAILGMLAMIAVPNVLDIYNKKKNALYTDIVNEIERVAQNYMLDNPDLYEELNVVGDSVSIDIDDLCENKYLDCPILDPRDNSEIKGYVSYSIYNDGHYVSSFHRT